MKDNDNIEIITTKNKIISNSNTIDFHKNLNIYSNLNNHNFITIHKNTNHFLIVLYLIIKPF